MNSQTLGLIIGGILPALLYGLSGIFTKASMQAGISIGWYLIITGAAVTITGIAYFSVFPDKTLSTTSGLHTILSGLTWGIGTGLVAIGIARYNIPIGKLVPLYNMNTLVTVLLALLIFNEWKQVQIQQLLLGSVLIIIGGILVARA